MRKIVTPSGQIQEIRSGGTGTFNRPPAAGSALPPPAAQGFPAPPVPWGSTPGAPPTPSAPRPWGPPPGAAPTPPPGNGNGDAYAHQQGMQPMPAAPGGPPPGIAPARVPGMTQSFNRGLIKQQVVGAYGQAKEILSVAEQEAARIIQDAERIREEQARLGWEEGYKKGYEEALAGLARVEAETQAVFAEIEPKIVQLSMRVAEKIIGQEMATRPDAIAAIVAQALKTVRHQKEVIVRVNPAQVPALEAHKKTLLGALSRAKDVSVRGDPSLRQGGCVIETELGILDADLTTQMEILERALQGGIPKTAIAGAEGNGGEDVEASS